MRLGRECGATFTAGRWSCGSNSGEAGWVPDSFGDLEVKVAALLHVGSLEVLVRVERKARGGEEMEKTGVVLVAFRMKRSREKVLAVVMREFRLVGEVAVTGIKALGQKEEPTDAVACEEMGSEHDS